MATAVDEESFVEPLCHPAKKKRDLLDVAFDVGEIFECLFSS